MTDKRGSQEGPSPPPPPPSAGLPYPQYGAPYAQTMPVGMGAGSYYNGGYQQVPYSYYQGAAGFHQVYYQGQQPPPPPQPTPYGVGMGGAGLVHFSPQYGYAHNLNVYPPTLPSAAPPPPVTHGVMVYPTPPPAGAINTEPCTYQKHDSNKRGKKNGQPRQKNAASAESNKKRKTSNVLVDPNELSADVEAVGSMDNNVNTGVGGETPPMKAEAFHSYCEACEKDFASSAAWQAHLAAHEKCPHEGCDFTATKKALSTHWQLVHGQFSGSGLKEIEVEVEGHKKKFKVLMGTSPEEVEKWREERRKKFPSAATVQAKQAELDKVKSLGGVETSMKTGARGKSVRGSDRDRKKAGESSGPAFEEGIDADALPGALRNDQVDKCASKSKSDAGGTKAALCQYFTRGKCKHGEGCRYTHDKAAQATYATERVKRQKLNASELEQLERKEHGKRGKLFLPKPLAGGDRGTLLKRLLQEDISAEENIILQCFRYMTSQDFFQDEPLGA